MFSWIPIYKEVADKLLDYETKQSDLIKIIGDLREKGLPVILISDKDKGDKPITLEEIDPFTFFASFNRGTKNENRIEVIQYLKDIWDLSANVPDDFAGIPVVNNQQSWFFGYKKDRKTTDIPMLWNLFKEALKGNIAEKSFNDVLDIKMVYRNITMGLFWIRPDQYLNIDKVNTAFLKKVEINANFTDYKTYAEILKQTNEKIDKEFFEISYEAWQDSQNKETTASEKEVTEFDIEVDVQKTIDKELETLPLNLILYGPPGTGKTYKIQNEYIPLFTDTKKVKTRSEYLSEVVEDLGWFRAIVLTMLDDEEMKVPEIVASELIQIKAKISTTKYVHAVIWGQLQGHTKQDCPNVNYAKRSEPYVFWKDENSTWKVDKEVVKQELPELYEQWQKLKNFKPVEEEERRYDFITFHQSFSYEDFIEGIKPNINQSLDESILENDSPYVIEPGIFLKMANKARLNPEKKYALFIDEINRGNVASVFGELITLIEKDKRGKLPVKLPYSKKGFTVPSNLFIIGTMNTADRSIEALDTALRRRFSFEEVIPEPGLLSPTKMPVEGIDLEKMLETINRRINVLLDKDHLIGHSYFMNIVNKSSPLKEIKEIFINNLIPLLEEYFYGDRSKIKMVLGPAFVKEEQIEDTDFFPIENTGSEIAYEKNFTYEIIVPENLEEFRSVYEKSNSDI